MKSMFSQWYQSLISWNKRLGVLVFIVLSCTMVTFAGDYRPIVNVQANPTGAGNVYVSTTQNTYTGQTAEGEIGTNGDTNKATTFYFKAEHTDADYLWYRWEANKGQAFTNKEFSQSLSYSSGNTYGGSSGSSGGVNTYTMPFTAKWVQPDVTGVTNGTANGTRQSTYDLGTVTNPTATTNNVAFTLSNDYAGLLDKNDVCPDYYSVATPLASNGYTNGNISHTKGSGSLTVPVIYTPTGIHGQTNSASLTVKSNYPSAGTNCWTAALTIAENYKPEFSLSTTTYNFTPNYPLDNSTSSSAYTLPITGRNYAASNIAEWDVSWGTVTYEGGTYPNANPYSLDFTDINNPKVIFTAPATGSYTDVIVTLTITAKYKDANGTFIPSDAKTITFSADAGNILKIGDLSAYTMDFGIVDFGTAVSKEVALISTYSDLTETKSNEVAGITLTPDYANDKITVSIANTTAIGSHTPSLTLKAGSVASAVLNVTAQVKLAKPVVTATTGLGQAIDLSWSAVNGATSYIVKSGATVLATIGDDEAIATTYKVVSIGGQSLVMGTEYPFTVTAVYASNTFGNRTSDEIKATPTAPATITKNDLSKLVLSTGTEIYDATNATYKNFPYYPKAKVDLSSTFASDGTPLFDKLYVFGLTTSTTALTHKGVNGHKITTPSATAGSNAITPCYIFTKNGNAYSLTTTVVNMNTQDKNTNFKITASEQKVYFTGYCPYATSGYAQDQYGAVEFTGGANKKIDIYLENLYLTARYHTADGRTRETQNDTIVCNISLTGITYIPASCAAFAFTTTNTKTSTPFQPTIHVLGSNELEGGKGAVRATVMGAVNRGAGLHSSPIHIVPTKDKQCTTLSIDDLWPTDASGNTSHTNGILDVAPSGDGRPSIDIGNEYSTVNVNGGQLFVKNSLPTSTSYLSTFAIGYRHYSQTSSVPVVGNVTVTLTGVGNDQGGGNVNFNDGTINCRPLTAANIEKYPYYRDTESMKCPTNTKINGGTYNCNIWACDAAANLGGSPTNSVGSELASLKVPVISEATAPYYLAKINFADYPGQLKNAVADDANFGKTLNDYYTRNNISYGHSSMMAVAAKNDGEPDSVMLMIPYQYTGKDVVEDVTVDNWALCIPTMSASGAGDLTFGGPITVSSDETHQTNFLLYASVDDYVTGLQDYTIPDVGLGDNVQITFNQDIFHENIQNTEPYRIEEAQYFFQAVRGDEWMFFCPSFDVTNVYILESYPEADLIEIAKTSLTDAYDLQARAATDLFFYLTYDAVISDSRGNMWEIYRKWRENSKLTKGAGAIKLTHFTGSNYDANYYLQRSSGTWEWNSEKSRFVTDWEYLPATMEKVTHGDEEYDVVMKKGQIYSMKFPYMYYGYRDEDNDGDGNGNWDYWTGKYVIFEGLGPQTIEGTNYHETITNPTITAPSGSAEIRANSTFASMDVSNMGAYYLGENQRFTPSPYDSELVPIDATQGFVLLNKSTASPMSQRIASIDMMTGDVTYEPGDGIENTVTGTPTISGEREMLVYTLAGGLGVVPVVSQQVSIYNAAGQLVVSQYLTGEMQFALPAGIYLVRGEKDQVKVMVK